MEPMEYILYLNKRLLAEMPMYRQWAATFLPDQKSQRRLLRGLMNLRPPLPLQEDFLQVQDALLSAEREKKGVVQINELAPTRANPKIILWQGDITRLQVDAIVNAANDTLLGCFCPCHGCIDNAIHSAAGLQLRDECNHIMCSQGHRELTGQAKQTKAYNLPCQYVFHTVGPVVTGPLTQSLRKELAACYRACLELAAKQHLTSIAFCCISTGEFHFPPKEAAQIALTTVNTFLQKPTSLRKVIFNVFQDSDYQIYRHLLGADCPTSSTY